MKYILLALLASATGVHANNFAFTDLAGYEKCLASGAMVEVDKSADTEHGRKMDEGEVQLKCIAHAVDLAKSKKISNADLLEYIKTTKANSSPERALDLVEVAARNSAAQCEDSAVYGVIKQALEHPVDYPTPATSYFKKAKSIVKLCLKNKEFVTDFAEESESKESYLPQNVCAILKEEKISNTCKK